jgi:hypothetical protein
MHLCPLSCSRRLRFGGGLFRPSPVRFAGHLHLPRVFLLAARAGSSHDPAVGRRIPAYLCFLLPKPAAGVQHIRDMIATRTLPWLISFSLDALPPLFYEL